MNKMILSALMAAMMPLWASAQEPKSSTLPPITTDEKPFHNVDVSLTGGSTGIGLEVGTKVSNTVRLRAGLSTMPHFVHDMNFEVRVGDQPAKMYDKEGNRIETKFDKLKGHMKELTGYDVDDKLVMEGRPKFWNASLIVDVMPFTNKHWYVSAGFYWGNSRFADAEVAKGDMTTMLAVGMYDKMYEKAINNKPFYTYNDQEIYNDQIANRLVTYGRMQYYIGKFKGTDEKCYIDPDENGMIQVKAKVNRFKPYIGFGYQGRISKVEPKWKIGFDAGLLFWGGKPKVYTDRTVEHKTVDPETEIVTYSYTKEQVDMARDLYDYPKNIKHKIGLLKALVVYPVLNLKITRTF